jgi:hypothetical protein
MNENELKKLKELKTEYIELKTEKLHKQRNLQTQRKAHQKELQQLHNELKLRKSKLLSNKDERNSSGFSNQKDWQNHIELVILKPQQTEITEFEEAGEKDLQILEEEIENLNLYITDAYWEFQIQLEYHKPEA